MTRELRNFIGVVVVLCSELWTFYFIYAYN